MWTPERPVSELPEVVRAYYTGQADWILDYLLEHRLEVVLVPAPDPRHQGHMIRVAISHNPGWYSDMFWENQPHFRRCRALDALDRIRHETDCSYDPESGNQRYKMDFLFRELVHSSLIEGHDVEGYWIHPINEVRRYFGFEDYVMDPKEFEAVPF